MTSSRDAASGAGSNTQARVHYLDTLKAVVVYGIILYHSALAFTWTSWLVSDPRKSLVAVLNLGIRWLDFRNRVTAYLSESILPVYVLHHPLVVLAATAVAGLELGAWSKFAMVAGFALATTLPLYELGVRRWAATRLLFGLKAHPVGRPRAGPAALSASAGPAIR